MIANDVPTSYQPHEPVACDCCLMPLAHGHHYRRSETRRGPATFPYTLCLECACDETNDARPQVNLFLIRRAGRYSPAWQTAVRTLLEVVR